MYFLLLLRLKTVLTNTAVDIALFETVHIIDRCLFDSYRTRCQRRQQRKDVSRPTVLQPSVAATPAGADAMMIPICRIFPSVSTTM